MSKLENIFEKNKLWVKEKLSNDPDFFTKLTKGQYPDILYIGCSDSRVAAEELMGVNPGELFVHRNIANLVVSTDNNVNAVVQYAVEQLKVKYIIVCGHYECGGVNAAMDPSDMGQLNSWLQTLRDVYRYHKQELDSIPDIKSRLDRLVELNVREQCINIIKIDHVQKMIHNTGYPIVHGLVFNVRNGELIDLELNIQSIFDDIRSIYDIKPSKTS